MTITALSSSFFLAYNCFGKIPSITQVNYNYNSKGEQLTVKDALKIIRQTKDMVIEKPALSFCGEEENTHIKDIEIKPILTNSIYFKNYNINVNSFKSDSVVISKQLALKLFFNTDVMGKKIWLYNKQFTVAGIYDNKDNFINAKSDDNIERVFLNYKIAENYSDVRVSELSYKNDSYVAVIMEQMNLKNYYFTNLEHKLRVIDNFRQIIILIIYLAGLIIGFRFWHKICKKQIQLIKETLQYNYILQSFKVAQLNYLILLATGVGIPCGFIALFFVCNFNLFIIPAYIPYDNIFDIGYYIGEFLESIQQFNSTALAGNTFALKLYSFSFTSLMYLTIIFAVLFTATILYISRLKQRGK